PRVLASLAMVRGGGFLSSGIPFGETARIALKPGVSVAAARAAIKNTLPSGGWRIRDRDTAAPGYARLIDQLEYFLGFIGLASLSADGALARNTYLIQIALLAALGVGIGLAVGAAAPLILGALVKNELPVPALFAIYPEPLARAALFGLLAAAAFSLAPLGRARTTPPAALFRQELAGRIRIGPELIGALLAAAALAW